MSKSMPTQEDLQPVLDQLHAWGYDGMLAKSAAYEKWGILAYGMWWDFSGCPFPFRAESMRASIQAAKEARERK